MIVFDRLEPPDIKLTGLYEFYVPTTDFFDAYIFKNNKWHFVKDVDARNPKKSDDNIKIERAPQKDF